MLGGHPRKSFTRGRSGRGGHVKERPVESESHAEEEPVICFVLNTEFSVAGLEVFQFWRAAQPCRLLFFSEDHRSALRITVAHCCMRGWHAVTCSLSDDGLADGLVNLVSVGFWAGGATP